MNSRFQNSSSNIKYQILDQIMFLLKNSELKYQYFNSNKNIQN